MSSTEGRRRVSWAIVAAIVAGCIVVAAGIMAGSWAVITVGGAVAVISGIGAVVLPRLGLSGPISLGVQYPSRTAGHRAGEGAHGPPIDTDPQRHVPLPGTIPTVPASQAPEPPDEERAKPQYVNLAPHERLRRVGGSEFIEVPDDELGTGP